MPEATTPAIAPVVVVTGGAGLVGGNIVRHLLAQYEDARVVVVEAATPAPVFTQFVAPYRDRVSYTIADVGDPAALDLVDPDGTATHLVHAAALCHVPAWEREDPRPFLRVNVDGTANVLDWARRRPLLQRVLHVSSGGVYGDPTPQHPATPQDEDGPFNPPETYAISKLAGEQVARRYGELYGLDVRVIRLSAVFGPLERATIGRSLMSFPYAAARGLGREETLTVSRRSLDAGGDWLSAEDVADAARRVLVQKSLSHRTFNIAAGKFTTVPTVLAALAEAAPGFGYQVVTDPTAAAVDMDPSLRLARWNAYSIERIQADTGWQPRPLVEQVDSYLRWALADPGRRCP